MVLVVVGVADRGPARPDGPGLHGLGAAEAGDWATTCSTGLPDALRTRSMRSARSQPERVSGSVEMMMSSTRKNCTPFIVATKGSGRPDHPGREQPLGPHAVHELGQPRAGPLRVDALAAFLRDDRDEEVWCGSSPARSRSAVSSSACWRCGWRRRA